MFNSTWLNPRRAYRRLSRIKLSTADPSFNVLYHVNSRIYLRALIVRVGDSPVKVARDVIYPRHTTTTISEPWGARLNIVKRTEFTPRADCSDCTHDTVIKRKIGRHAGAVHNSYVFQRIVYILSVVTSGRGRHA